MFRIKICGITTPEDALAAVEAGAEVIGLNFYAKSSRFVSLELAHEIVEVVPAAVGVFVNKSPEAIDQIAERLQLSHVQLHGDEPPEQFAQVGSESGAIRVYRLGRAGMDGLVEDMQACRMAGRQPSAVLVDASAASGQYGGTGETVCWGELAEHRDRLGEVPLILAGGLTPKNVVEAIRTVRPAAVDVASGVESAPGKKDSAKMREFVEAAIGAFDSV